MAGDWIKIECTTPDKPEVFQMAEMLEIDPDAVVGKLIRVWVWADQHTRDGHAPSVTKALLDRYANVTGFAEAMIAVGWLIKSDSGIQFEKFDRHNGKTAKTRALSNKRQSAHRSSNANVTQVALQPRDKSVTREEKRREEIKKEEEREPVRLGPETAQPMIPPKANTPGVWAAVRRWRDHLDSMADSHTLHQDDSPQLIGIFVQAAEMGEAKFIKCIDWNIANGHRRILDKWLQPGRAGGGKADATTDAVWMHVSQVLSSTDDTPSGMAERVRLLSPEQREAVKRCRAATRLSLAKSELDRRQIAQEFTETMRAVVFERTSAEVEKQAKEFF